MSQINNLVIQFNENNKSIKDVNKEERNKNELNDLIQSNTFIIEQCNKIDERIAQGIQFGNQISQRLDTLLDQVIMKFKKKFESKN